MSQWVKIMSIKAKLSRLKPHLSHHSNKQEIHKEKCESTLEIPFLEKWEKEGVKPYYFDGSYCLVREREYPIRYQHGKYAFSKFLEVIDAWNSTSVTHPLSAKGNKAEELFFFDTETTGLGGGVGNSIFILGHASVSKNTVILKQHILPQPGAEIPLYNSFLESVNYETMVTYNGKAFDWPQVKTRHTLIREHVPRLPSFGHFDLFHAAKRMWKHRLERMKLSIVEKEVLDFERVDDIPGYLAPMIYFDFVERRDPEGMIGVLKHNEQDILSLISLYTHLSAQILGLDSNQTTREVFEIGRWFSHIGESSLAQQAFKTITDGEDIESYYAKHALAFEYKKQKQWSKAAELWEDVLGKGLNEIEIEACIELAKIYEHREIDLHKALFFAEKAEVIFQDDLKIRQSKYMITKEEIAKRLARLNLKIIRHKNFLSK